MQDKVPNSQALPISEALDAASTAAPKARDPPFVGLALEHSVAMIPNAKKAHRWGGEDSYFISPNAFGVADGVSGHYAKYGMDSGIVSRFLMAVCGAVAPQCSDALSIMQFAYDVSRGESVPGIGGATTATIAVLDGQVLRTALLGDSLFLVVRDGKPLYRSEPQAPLNSKGVPRPYQLHPSSSDPNTEVPTHAHLHNFEVEYGDVIVMATDGLWDRVKDEVIVPVLTQVASGSLTPNDGANKLAWMAFEKMMSWTDDVTVIVAKVGYAESVPSPVVPEPLLTQHDVCKLHDVPYLPRGSEYWPPIFLRCLAQLSRYGIRKQMSHFLFIRHYERGDYVPSLWELPCGWDW